MKKTKYLALVLVVAVMMMGAGYAIWSDQAVLNTTVSTGNFAMDITGVSTRTGDDQVRNEKHSWNEFDWTHAGESEFTKDEAIVEFKDLYPGGMVQVGMKMENKGTIPAKLVGAEVKYISGKKKLFDLLQAETSWKADINGDGVEDKYAHVEWGRADWYNIQEALNAIVKSSDDENLVIEPKGYKYEQIKIKLNPGAGNEFQDESVKFKIIFNWEQWASNPKDNPYQEYGGDGDLQ